MWVCGEGYAASPSPSFTSVTCSRGWYLCSDCSTIICGAVGSQGLCDTAPWDRGGGNEGGPGCPYLPDIVGCALVVGELQLPKGNLLAHPMRAGVGRIGVQVEAVPCSGGGGQHRGVTRSSAPMEIWDGGLGRKGVSPYLACCPQPCRTAPTCRPGNANGVGPPTRRPRTRCNGPRG